MLQQQVQDSTERYLETAYGQTRLQARYDWDTVVLDSNARRMVRTDFELFFEREEWFRQHNLPYRRGYLLWGPPGNGKSATIRVMAAHPHIRPYTLDMSDMEEKSADVHHLFQKAAENTPALVILEDLDRAFPTEAAAKGWRRDAYIAIRRGEFGPPKHSRTLNVAAEVTPRASGAGGR